MLEAGCSMPGGECRGAQKRTRKGRRLRLVLNVRFEVSFRDTEKNRIVWSRPPASAVRLARRHFALPDGVALQGEESESGLFSSNLRIRFGSEAPGEPSGSRCANADPLFLKQHPSFLLSLISAGRLANVPCYQSQLRVLSVQGCGGAGSRVGQGTDGVPLTAASAVPGTARISQESLARSFAAVLGVAGVSGPGPKDNVVHPMKPGNPDRGFTVAPHLLNCRKQGPKERGL